MVCLNNMRKLVKRNAHEGDIQAAKCLLSNVTREYKKLLKKENNSHNLAMHNKEKHTQIWDFIKDSTEEKYVDTSNSVLCIDDKQGVELANHMAKYFYERAHLVTDDAANEFKEFIPLPIHTPEDQIILSDTEEYDLSLIHI